LQKAVELALSGDVPMLRFLLSRLLPRDRLIRIELPQLEFATTRSTLSVALLLQWPTAQ
jgi:hypothetical protein